jgi:hypothetical protein
VRIRLEPALEGRGRHIAGTARKTHAGCPCFSSRAVLSGAEPVLVLTPPPCGCAL